MNFIYTLKNFKCNKHCPYCISKLLKPRKREDIDMLPQYLQDAKDEGKVFEEFVLSSNGEPTMYSLEKLKFIADTVNASSMFKRCRIQTSGMLFFERDKLEVFNGWLKEITVVSTDFAEDSKILKYKRNYFKLAKVSGEIRANLVILKDISKVNADIRELLSFSDTVALKVLDGTNPWIKGNALSWDDADTLVEHVSAEFGEAEYNSVQGRYIWNSDGKLITMSYGKKRAHDHIIINVKG